MKELSFRSNYFKSYMVEDGVIALIDIDETGSNAGLINLGEDVLVFDTFLNVEAAKDMKKLCLELFDKNPTYVINSHSHSDHIIGNCIFESKVISSKLVKDNIENFKTQLTNEKDEIIKQVNEIKEKLPNITDEVEIKNLKNQLNYYSNFIKEDVYIKVPEITFNTKLSLKDKFELQAYDIAHSEGDVIGYLPNHKICFMGDLLFTKNHPWLGNGKPERTIEILENLLEYDFKYFIPGHGPIATKDDIKEQIMYIKEIIQLVKSKINTENPTFDKSELSQNFKDWNDLTFDWNVKSLLNIYKNK